MALALRFDGVNDYANSANWTPTTSDYSVEVKFSTVQTTSSWSGLFSCESYSDNKGFALMARVGSLTVHILDGVGDKNPHTISSTSISDGVMHTAKLVCSSSETKVYLDAVLVYTTTRVPLLSIHPVIFGGRNANSGAGMTDALAYDLEYCHFVDDSAPANSRYFSADASDHSNTGSQPVLVDTVGSNDATGTGFPTDGSAWVDLGGGGGNDVILDVDNGSFALSGSDVLLSVERIEQALNGNYNLSGSDINFSIGYAINLDGGIYSLSGSATGLVLNANTVIESGEYSLIGTQVNLDLARKSIIESGSYNLTGSDVTLIYTPSGGGEVLSIDSGTFSLSGSDIELKAARLISLNAGNYNLAGQSVALTYNAKTIIDGGSYALTGSNINLFANRVIIASSGSYTLSGTSVILKYSGDTYKTIGTVTAGFAQDRYSVEYKLNTITVNFKD